VSLRIVGRGSRDSANQAAGQHGVHRRNAEANAVGEVGLDRRRLAGRGLQDANRDRQKSWQSRCLFASMLGLHEPESALPGVEFRPGDAFLVAELRDGQAAGFLAADAVTPYRMEAGIGGSCHGVDSWKGLDDPLRRQALKLFIDNMTANQGNVLINEKDWTIKIIERRSFDALIIRPVRFWSLYSFGIHYLTQRAYFSGAHAVQWPRGGGLRRVVRGRRAGSGR
jgi:hypothetical protein